jgi:hypothetical protein
MSVYSLDQVLFRTSKGDQLMQSSGEAHPKGTKQSSQKQPVPEETGTSWQFLFVIGVVILGFVALVVKVVIGM